MFELGKLGRGNLWLTKEGILAKVGRRPALVLLPAVENPQEHGPRAVLPAVRLLCGPEQLLCLSGQYSYLHPRVIEITHPFPWLQGLVGVGWSWWGEACYSALPAAYPPPPFSAFPPKDKRAI